MADRLFLIDGTAYAFRSFHAIRTTLTDRKGRPTNAVYGFVRVVLKILREQAPSHVAVVFDDKGKNFRHEQYPEYKANRKEAPAELIEQFPLIDETVHAMALPLVRVPGCEADDAMGTLARRAEAQGLETVLVSGDKDLLQLVTDRVKVFDPNRGKEGAWYGPDEVRARFGVAPEHVVDVLGLMGDASDNVPGVPGIGEKTARKLLEQHETLERLYDHLDALKGKQLERLREYKDQAFLSRDLVTIRTDVDVPIDVDACRRRDWDRGALIETFSALSFESILDELDLGPRTPRAARYELVLTEAQLEAAVAAMRQAGRCAVDTETTSVEAMRAKLVGVSLSCQAHTGYYIPIAHAPEACMRKRDEGELFAEDPVACVPAERALELLRPLLEDADVAKIGHNLKYDFIVLDQAGVRLAGIAMDTMVASYLTDPSRLRHNLNEVSLQYLGRQTIPISELIGKGSKACTFDQVPIELACEYACEDADVAWQLAETLQPLLQERALEPLFAEIEMPLIEVLARMEMTGIALDAEVFEALQKELTQRLAALEAAIYEAAGERFQINSPKQLQRILFEKLGLKPLRKTKTGYSTDVEVLEQLAFEHPLPEKIVAFRTLEKLRSTYVEALPKLRHPDTQRLHTSLNQAVTATGRLSSSAPNLQNIPVRTELGRRIREGFVPEGPDRRLISADYSQVELRILAHLSGDEGLCSAFRAGQDVHRQTAARAFGVALDAVTPDMRRQAKAINFGVIYGISPFGLAKSLGATQAQAAAFIEQYFAQFPGVRRWIDETVAFAREHGYVTTLLNRRRYLPELAAAKGSAAKAAERAAINTPVQGSAADLIKKATIEVDRALQPTQTRLVLQVHDELLAEAPADEAEAAAQQMKQIMERAIALDVPLRVDVSVGRNWAEIHG